MYGKCRNIYIYIYISPMDLMGMFSCHENPTEMIATTPQSGRSPSTFKNLRSRDPDFTAYVIYHDIPQQPMEKYMVFGHLKNQGIYHKNL